MNDFQFIEKMKKIQQNVLKFIDDGNTEQEQQDEFFNFLKDEEIEKDRNEFKLFLLLISRISNNYFRKSLCIDKIEGILKYYFTDIQKNFENDEIFHIFNRNKLIILFLIENNIFQINNSISLIMTNGYYKSTKYPEYFYTEIKNFTDIQIEAIPDDFEAKRKIGENDSKICELIRNDRIDEFIVYINQNNVSLDSKISDSLFETNLFLLKHKPSLIEYSAFCGSIQIFKYLTVNKVELKPSIWLYGIHGNNPELIHLLEDNQISIENYNDCLFESIKCHHNEIANYFMNNYINENDSKFNKKLFSKSFHYHNYYFFPNNLDQTIYFFFASEFDYLPFVEYFINVKKVDINLKIISLLI